MILVDKDIKRFVENADGSGDGTFIANGIPDSVTNIGYDLRAGKFWKDKKESNSCRLRPGESVFVGSEEIIQFGNQTVGRVALKNSRIRMGLTMDSPVYQPGHKTRIYFRLSNVSKNIIELEAGQKYVMVIFERLDDAPETLYQGTFSDEFDFKDLADYESVYARQVQDLDEKFKDLDSLEKTIYGNVISVLAIFVAAFTLLNVNVSMAKASKSVIDFLIYNLSVLGCISALVLLMDGILGKKKTRPILWIVPGICLVVLIVIAVLFL